MDDVQHRLIEPALALTAALKTWGLFSTGQLVAGWLMGVAAVLIVVRPRLGAAAVAVAAATILTSHEVVLLLSVAVIVAVFQGGQRRLLLRTQMTALYLFAGLSKLTPQWLAGELALRGESWAFDLLPGWLVVWGIVTVELSMVPLLWKAPRLAVAVAVGLHVAIVAGMWTVTPDYRIALVTFNGLALAAVASANPIERKPCFGDEVRSG